MNLISILTSPSQTFC